MTFPTGDTTHCGAAGYWSPHIGPRGHGSKVPHAIPPAYSGCQTCNTKASHPNWILGASKNPPPRSPFRIMIQRYAAVPDARSTLLTSLECYLCPGNKRAQGDVNPKYERTFVFVNDYSAVRESQAEYHPEGDTTGFHPSSPCSSTC